MFTDPDNYNIFSDKEKLILALISFFSIIISIWIAVYLGEKYTLWLSVLILAVVPMPLDFILIMIYIICINKKDKFDEPKE